MLVDVETTGRAAAGRVLCSGVPGIAAEWEVECQADPPLPDAGRVILALAHALGTGPAASDFEPAPSLRAVAASLVSGGPGLDVVVRQLGGLRSVLHRRVVGAFPPATALEAQRHLNGAIDALVERCTAAATDNLERGAFVDPLTGLLNRRALDRDLARELALAARHQRSVSVVVGDLDGLKAINDTLGHAAGDEALCRLAAALQVALRAGDTAYRVGGDEFVVLLPASSAADVHVVVERVRGASAPAFGWGSATFPEDATAPAQLLDLADQRLLARRRVARAATPVAAGALASAPPYGSDGTKGQLWRRRLVLAGTLLVAMIMAGAGVLSMSYGDSGAGGDGPSRHRAARPPAVTPTPPLQAPSPCAPDGAGALSGPTCAGGGSFAGSSTAALTPAEASAAALLGPQAREGADD